MRRHLPGLVVLALVLSGVAHRVEADGLCAESDPARTHWRGPDGQPLPFACSAEVLDFLRTARVTGRKELSSGSTKPLKLRLERDGVVANAIFRRIDVEKERERLADGSFHLLLRDSYRQDVAAYELARLLGLDNVPPATTRTLDGREGGIQLWLEDVITERQRIHEDRRPPSYRDFAWQLRTMQVFDALIANIDRNRGNILVDSEWRVWLVDHTRSFARHEPDQVVDASLGVDAAFLEHLRRLDPEDVKTRLSPYIDCWQIEGLLARRARLLAAFDAVEAAAAVADANGRRVR